MKKEKLKVDQLWHKAETAAAVFNTVNKILFFSGISQSKLFSKERTKKWADFPTLFSENRQPQSKYLLFPKVSSERRKYILNKKKSQNIIRTN